MPPRVSGSRAVAVAVFTQILVQSLSYLAVAETAKESFTVALIVFDVLALMDTLQVSRPYPLTH